MDTSTALSFAAATNNGVLTTQKRDGRPQWSNITHLVGDDGTVRISVASARAKYLNLSRDRRASLHVTSPSFDEWVVLECDATLLPVVTSPDHPTVAALIDLYRGVLGEHPDWDDYRRAMVTERRTVIELRPVRAYGQLR